jgi:hypothetical protein
LLLVTWGAAANDEDALPRVIGISSSHLTAGQGNLWIITVLIPDNY